MYFRTQLEGVGSKEGRKEEGRGGGREEEKRDISY